MILPKINRIVIENFSLYKLHRKIEIAVPDGVLCLAGANGLGKSTFISIVSYAMTGVVVPPKIEFRSLGSLPNFVQKASGFYSDYFEGRVEQRDRDLSQVTVEFCLGEYHYKLTRNFFDSSELTAFARFDAEGKDTVKGDISLLGQYKEFFVIDSKLSSFDQYIFIQAYVMTFDESKKLLFWDEDVMNRLMYLFFSITPEAAECADTLKKNIKRFESNMRNLQWEISKMEKRLARLRNSGVVTEDERNQIEAACDKEKIMQEGLEELNKTIQDLNADLGQKKLSLDNNVLTQHSVKTDYDQTFSSLYSGGAAIDNDERVKNSLNRIIVKLSEDENADVNELRNTLRSEIVGTIKRTRLYNQETNMQRLKALDVQLQGLKAEEQELRATIARKQQEVLDKQQKTAEMATALEQYVKENEAFLQKKDALLESEQTRREIQALEINIAQRKKEKKDNEDKREASMSELMPLEEGVKKSFSTLSETFVPSFKNYAKSFIGLDIDVELREASGMVSLVLNVNGSDRRSRFQLSESQQYFLDIALRFSLIELSGATNTFMLIDTPEGSLDIAYESRAGKMFADFVAKGNGVIMTANINSSQLLLKLAEKCGKDKMKVERMTDWTILTQVQQEEQEIIEQAYTAIEQTLNQAHA